VPVEGRAEKQNRPNQINHNKRIEWLSSFQDFRRFLAAVFLCKKPPFLSLQTTFTDYHVGIRQSHKAAHRLFLSHQAAFMTGGLPCRGKNKVEIATERISDCHCEEKHGFDVAISTLTFAFLAMTF